MSQNTPTQESVVSEPILPEGENFAGQQITINPNTFIMREYDRVPHDGRIFVHSGVLFIYDGANVIKKLLAGRYMNVALGESYKLGAGDMSVNIIETYRK